MRIATIDVGTNTILLLIADVAGDEVRVVEDRARVERLGRGVDRTGVLDEAAIGRGLDALREYAAAIRAARPDRVIAVGTQALREAKNGAAFLEPAAEILGVPVEVIGGEREAQLAFAAVMQSFPALRQGPVVVCDVGGGSTEYIAGRDGAIVSATSVPIGSVRLAERFLTSDPPSADEARRLTAFIDEALAPLALPRGVPLVGTAGTATTLGAVAHGVTPYDPERVHGVRLPRAEIERQLHRYLALPSAERAAALPGLDPKRADVIPAGAAILARTLEKVGADELIVSDRGIRFGLLFEQQ